MNHLKKKWMLLGISFGFVAFVSITIHSSVATGEQVSPLVAHEQVMVNAQSSTATANPYGISQNYVIQGISDTGWYEISRWDFAKESIKAADPKLAGTLSSTTSDPDAERIFDK